MRYEAHLRALSDPVAEQQLAELVKSIGADAQQLVDRLAAQGIAPRVTTLVMLHTAATMIRDSDGHDALRNLLTHILSEIDG